ncbi:TolC family protein [Bilophila wadsworthia]|uniref:TolC family protein n=2 Tax=Bilophila wadsworthia TaxID=35833 RepID=UPI003AB59EC4
MMNAIRLFAALLVLGLGGCANYPMSSLKTDLLPAEDVAASYSLNTAWWKGYHDADLDRIVALALERNVDLALSAIKVNRALYQARLLSADLVPSFSANASAAVSHNIDNGNAARSYQTEFGVSYEVDLWQKLRNAANAQEWEYKATMEDREAARLALVNSVADTYFELKYLDESIKVMDASVKRYQELLRLIEAKYEFGKVASVEPLQAQQSLLSARNSLLDLEDRQNVARQTLRDLLNIRPGENPAIGNADLMSYPTVGVDLDVPVAALSARPDIRASEARLQSAFKTLESDRASWYPTISIGSTLGTSSSTSSKVFDLPLLAGTVRVSFPFLQWNTIRWNIKISEADFESAKLDFTQAVTSALNEVDTAYFSYANAQRSLENTLSKHQKDVRIGEYYQTRYDLGAAELKDYLDALNTADNSMLSALEAKYRVIRYENQIYKAMGGRYERILPPSGGKATQGHTSTNGETHVPSQRNQ